MFTYRYVNEQRFPNYCSYDLIVERDDGTQVARSTVSFPCEDIENLKRERGLSEVACCEEQVDSKESEIRTLFTNTVNETTALLLDRLQGKDLLGFFRSVPEEEREPRILAALEELRSVIEATGESILARLPDKVQ